MVNKKIILLLLKILSIIIILSGLFFGVFCYLNDIKFKVINTSIPGFVFGLVVAFLGTRYFISVNKLKKEISDPKLKFSWENFKPSKKKSKKSRKLVKNSI